MSKSGSGLFKYTTGANATLMDELERSGEKYTKENVIGITKDKSGKLVWLETGTDYAGYNHIEQRHLSEFQSQGISKEELPNYILEAVHQGNIVGYQGPKPIYEFVYEGQTRRVAIGISNNGFIVGANPKSWRK